MWVVTGPYRNFCLWEIKALANLKENRFGIVMGAGGAFMAIITGRMDSFMDQYRPVAVNQSPDGQYQMLIFEYPDGVDQKEYEEKVLDAIGVAGIDSARVINDLSSPFNIASEVTEKEASDNLDLPDNIVPFDKAKGTVHKYKKGTKK